VRKAGRRVMLAVMLCAALPGCGNPPRLANGPIVVEQSQTIPFIEPVTADAGGWELCFEFETPGDSQNAHNIEAMLRSDAGRVYPLGSPRYDRRAESVVCHIYKEPLRVPGAAPIVFDAVILRSSMPVRLRGLSGGPPPGAVQER